ncbi:UDP-N-acetylmuramoyl-L-alanyl-D-glutamate--2,6-diaminopimelate ligase [Magnetospirillum sulfuroxidans]|uniref:UDP-N-acetylmuramoyl-L-alanyl-D-glutamate--2, 6-diaminopimelate ligase n=1 Tax=Magnetospirillum sulfuroxidans TaxID=611300 RepID=UPI00201151D9|nr:UDP-N-acetylmuramoyl-L-alanyl-D-glutamate--2,6-diaminopimelate ligase [Magnetospirillum sulfuroxidans]
MPNLADLTGHILSANPIITGITCDSRNVVPGMLFAALSGAKADGRAFIAQAVEKGAAAILAANGTQAETGTAVLVTDDNPRRAYALAAAAFHQRQPAVMAAITGTNGKTSGVNFTRQIWRTLGYRSAALGTLGIVADGWPNRPSLTTPDPADLHAALAELAADGITHAAMEASSHGLDQYRLDGVRLQAAAFTNLTRDHLDYHGSMESYLAAKLRLFSDLLPEGGVAVINADCPIAAQVAHAAGARRLIRCGRAGAELALKDIRPDVHGQVLDLDVLGQAVTIRLPLAGSFQAANALTALGLVIGCGGNAQAAALALENLEEIPGRLQKVADKNDAPIFVDYAHTPDALETVLTALRPHVRGRLLVVFGCGGDRDPGKRPQMGEIAARLADLAIVTDDNPRSEDPGVIRAAILAAAPRAVEIADRRAAIVHAVSLLRNGDVLVVAGKGHESGQIIGAHTLPFDDASECRIAAGGAA